MSGKKLSKKQREEVRSLYQTGEFTLEDLSDTYGVSCATISRITNTKDNSKVSTKLSEYSAVDLTPEISEDEIQCSIGALLKGMLSSTRVTERITATIESNIASGEPIDLDIAEVSRLVNILQQSNKMAVSTLVSLFGQSALQDVSSALLKRKSKPLDPETQKQLDDLLNM